MKTLLLVLQIMGISLVLAQTPKIMHKRMGGTDADFVTNIKNQKSPIRQSNFGLPPTVYVKRAVIDSIIVVNDSSVLVVTSHQIIQEFAWYNYDFDTVVGAFVCHDSILQKSLTYDSTGLWQPGRDLMVHHAIFNPELTCHEIIYQLNQQFGLHYATINTIFVGFDCSNQGNSRKSKKGEFWWLDYWTKNPNNFILIALTISLIYFLILQINRVQIQTSNTGN